MIPAPTKTTLENAGRQRRRDALSISLPGRLPAGDGRKAPPGGYRETERNTKSRTITMGFKVAVVGATGNVGREMMNILAEREFPADEVVAIASRKSLGQEVSYGDKTLKVRRWSITISPTPTSA